VTLSRILVLDDEVSLRRVLRSILEQAGHTVFEAPDGREGMALWRRERTDVVLTDLYMPNKDGIEVLLEMQDLTTRPKIIVMSGGGQKSLSDLSSAALSLGADRVLVKPFDAQTLLAAIQEVLAGHSDTTDVVPRQRSTDERKHARIPVYFPASFGDGTIEQTGTVLDISPEGCRIRCSTAPPALQYFRVEIHPKARQERLKVDLAQRRWSRDGDLGVEFIRIEHDHQVRLQSVIRNC
jgi:DNA-binding response OmpR family regulator